MADAALPQIGGVATGPAGSTFTAVAVAAKSSGTVAVNINGAIRTINAARDLTIAAGDVLICHRFGSLWMACARIGTASLTEAPAILADLDPNPATVTGSLTVLAESTGTYRGGAWNTIGGLVRQGQRGGAGNAVGAVFYGTKPRTLAGSTVTSARLESIHLLDGPAAGTASTMRLITESSRPAGTPTLGSSTAGPGIVPGELPISFTIPTSWAQAMVDGTSGGIGFYVAGGSPYLHYAGLETRPSSFTLVIDWSRNT